MLFPLWTSEQWPHPTQPTRALGGRCWQRSGPGKRPPPIKTGGTREVFIKSTEVKTIVRGQGTGLPRSGSQTTRGRGRADGTHQAELAQGPSPEPLASSWALRPAPGRLSGGGSTSTAENLVSPNASFIRVSKKRCRPMMDCTSALSWAQSRRWVPTRPKPQPARAQPLQTHLRQLVELLEHAAHVLGKLLRGAVGGRQLLLEAGADQGQVQRAARLILQAEATGCG